MLQVAEECAAKAQSDATTQKAYYDNELAIVNLKLRQKEDQLVQQHEADLAAAKAQEDALLKKHASELDVAKTKFRLMKTELESKMKEQQAANDEKVALINEQHAQSIRDLEEVISKLRLSLESVTLKNDKLEKALSSMAHAMAVEKLPVKEVQVKIAEPSPVKQAPSPKKFRLRVDDLFEGQENEVTSKEALHASLELYRHDAFCLFRRYAQSGSSLSVLRTLTNASELSEFRLTQFYLAKKHCIALAKDAKLLHTGAAQADLYPLFTELEVEQVYDAVSTNNGGRELKEEDFFEFLVRLSHLRYADTEDLQERSLSLWNQDLSPIAHKFSTGGDIRTEIYTLDVQTVLREFKVPLHQVYTEYAAAVLSDQLNPPSQKEIQAGTNTMNLREFLFILRDFGLLDQVLTHIRALYIFLESIHQPLEEPRRRSPSRRASMTTLNTPPLHAPEYELVEEEFLESIVRVAVYRYSERRVKSEDKVLSLAEQVHQFLALKMFPPTTAEVTR